MPQRDGYQAGCGSDDTLDATVLAVTHELNNALTIIRGNVALLQHTLPEIQASAVPSDHWADIVADLEAIRVAADQATACSRRLSSAAQADCAH